MPLVCLGLSHNTAPVEVRERHVFPVSRMGEALVALRDYEAVREALMLQTCGRLEIYAELDDYEAGVTQLKSFLQNFRHASVEYDLESYLYTLLGREARLVNMSELGKALTQLGDPPVKAVVVYNSNPAAIAPNQNLVLRGFRREDLFAVVLEQFQTDTADYADIVLPSTTFLEHTDLYRSYGHYHVQLARPVVPPPGEARSNVEVFRALARRMGFDDPCLSESDDDMIRTLLGSGHAFLDG